MNLPEIIDQTWMQALGWTLVHSLWQGLGVVIVTITLLKLIDKRSSSLRYVIACTGMAVVLLFSVGTFVWKINALSFSDTTRSGFTQVNFPGTASASDATLVETISSAIEQHMAILILLWACGSFLFIVRLAGGLFWLHRLTQSATPMNNGWQEIVSKLVNQLGITNLVRLAESTRIDSPMVVGYLKPLILLPAGMIGGLTTEQVEAILLHELAHIKRHDFLVNIIQSCVEVIFFFNPFTWILSDAVRKEREYCCDDVVVMNDRNPLVYAQALATLEEVRMSRPSVGLALAGEKKHLLNRIKRIMETPLKRKMAGERALPVVLLVVGLICASWLSIRGDEKIFTTVAAHAADTLKKTERSSTYYRKSIRTEDDKRNSNETIAEDFDGNASLLPMLAMAPTIDLPATIGHTFAMPAFPSLPDHISYYHMDGDSVPLRRIGGANLERFSAEFEEQFKEKFADFYKKNAADINKMMKEIQQNLETELSNERWVDLSDLEVAMAEQSDMLRELQVPMEMDLARQALHSAQSALDDLEIDQEIQAEQMAELAKHMKELEFENLDHLKELDLQLAGLQKEMAAFEAGLKKQLTADGYIEKDEELKDISWEDDGAIEVNGKKIKDSDKKKYQELHEKYFKHGPGKYHYVE
jgi:bla regulator protein blaR1